MKPYKINQREEKEKRLKALKVLQKNYNKDPAFWMDVLNSNSDQRAKQHAYNRLWDLGWEVIKHG